MDIEEKICEGCGGAVMAGEQLCRFCKINKRSVIQQTNPVSTPSFNKQAASYPQPNEKAFCRGCGSSIDITSSFCSKCGASQSVTSMSNLAAPIASAPIPPGSLLCTSCGSIGYGVSKDGLPSIGAVVFLIGGIVVLCFSILLGLALLAIWIIYSAIAIGTRSKVCHACSQNSLIPVNSPMAVQMLNGQRA